MHLARFLVIYTGPELGPEKIIILARLLIYRTFVYRGLTVVDIEVLLCLVEKAYSAFLLAWFQLPSEAPSSQA